MTSKLRKKLLATQSEGDRQRLDLMYLTDSLTREVIMSHSNDPVYHLTDNEKITLCIFNVFSMAFGLLGNIIVVTVLRMDKNSRGMPTTMFLRSLAVSDILVIAIVQPLYVYSFFHEDDIINLAQAIHASRWALIFASLLHLFVVSMDRFLAICRPNLYHQKLKHSCSWCITVLIIVWCLMIALGTTLTLVPETTARMIHRIIGFLCFLVIISLISIHIRLFAVATRHRKKIEKEQAVKGYVTPNSPKVKDDSQGLHEEEKLRTHHHFLRLHLTFFRELKAFKTTSIVCGAFLLSWLPLLVTGLIYATSRDTNKKEVMLRVFPYVNTLAFLNSAQNPFIYSFKIRAFRESLQTIAGRIVTRICWSRHKSTIEKSKDDEEV